ncbi:MAG TPA: hypothetical protein VEY94_02590 [Patescibacteria group bacterium]|nr:hypothetical protein [Patescibacteria group bacterium]
MVSYVRIVESAARTMARMIRAHTLADLERAQYRFDGHSTCSGCGKSIEFWTSPNAERIAYDRMIDIGSHVKPHRCHSHDEPTSESLARHRAFRGA